MDTNGPDFPQRCGADDTIGAFNEVTPEKVRRAAGLVKEGRRHSLAHVLESDAPRQLARFWKSRLELERLVPGRRAGANMLTR